MPRTMSTPQHIIDPATPMSTKKASLSCLGPSSLSMLQARMLVSESARRWFCVIARVCVCVYVCGSSREPVQVPTHAAFEAFGLVRIPALLDKMFVKACCHRNSGAARFGGTAARDTQGNTEDAEVRRERAALACAASSARPGSQHRQTARAGTARTCWTARVASARLSDSAAWQRSRGSSMATPRGQMQWRARATSLSAPQPHLLIGVPMGWPGMRAGVVRRRLTAGAQSDAGARTP